MGLHAGLDLILRYHAAEDPFASEPPHVYCVAHGALNEVAVQASRGQEMRSQSILVSGESGAGKTETTKHLMRYLAWRSEAQSSKAAGKLGALADAILSTNPLLEAFGNAKTVRNNNSSRFGKHFDIQFSESGAILGAFTSTYLLEKPRIANHMDGERNYHVFYMLCKAGAAHLPEAVTLGPWEEDALQLLHARARGLRAEHIVQAADVCRPATLCKRVHRHEGCTLVLAVRLVASARVHR